MNTHDPGHDRFDQRLRALHADALAQVSAGTMAQLHRRRAAALSGEAAGRSRRLGWRLPAAAFASLLVAAVGLGFGLQAFRDGAPPAPAAAPAVATLDAGTGIEDVLDDLGQNPDFYAWLASGDADLLAME